MYEFGHIVELRSSGWTVFSGMDQQCLFAAMFGSSGNIGSTLNYMPGVYREIHKCYKNGDLVRGRELQIRANKVIRVMHSVGTGGAVIGTLKKMVGILGFDYGNPRLPNLPLPEGEMDTLCAKLEAADFSTLAEM